MDVAKAAVALFTEGFQEFWSIRTVWPNDHTCHIQNNGSPSSHVASLYFHSENVILDLDKAIIDGGDWKRFSYADPAYPYNLIELLYGRILHWLRGFGGFQQTEQIINLLLAQNKRLHLGQDDGGAGVLVVRRD